MTPQQRDLSGILGIALVTKSNLAPKSVLEPMKAKLQGIEREFQRLDPKGFSDWQEQKDNINKFIRYFAEYPVDASVYINALVNREIMEVESDDTAYNTVLTVEQALQVADLIAQKYGLNDEDVKAFVLSKLNV